MDDPLRVIIRVRVTDIPGDPEGRVYRLGRDFCEQILKRPFNKDLQAKCHDAMHFLPNFDSENDVTVWFMYDFNVTGSLEREEVRSTPHQIYLATRTADSWDSPYAEVGSMQQAIIVLCTGGAEAM